MKSLRKPARGSADAALQLTLPLFDAPPQPRPAPPPDLPPAGRRGPAPVGPLADPPPASSGPAARGRRVVHLGGQPVVYELRRSRRRTIGFCVDDAGLRVTAPRWVTVTEIDSALTEKSRWILRKLLEWRAHAQRRERLAVRWEDGGQVAFLGRSLTLRVDPDAREGVVLEADELRVRVPADAGPEPLRAAVQGWLQAQARELFAQRLPLYAARLGRAPSRWRLSSARTRWGSCAPDGSIRLNWRLVHFPVAVVDYVVAHELAHLKEMNHSPRFWDTVRSMLPAFEAARHLLKDYPDDLAMS